MYNKSEIMKTAWNKFRTGNYATFAMALCQGYTECKRTDIDKKALAAEHSDIYAAYLKETTYKRFSVA